MDKYLKRTAVTLARVDIFTLNLIRERLIKAKLQEQTVFLIGNGGSASTASHAANDLMKIGGLKAVCVCDMTPTTLAYGNDDGWENMFLTPIRRLSVPGDVVIGISCSGNSPNVVKVAEYPLKGYDFIGFTGNGGGELENYADILIKVPNSDIRVQRGERVWCNFGFCS